MILAGGKEVKEMDEIKVSVLFWEDRDQGGAAHDDVVDQVAGALSEGGHKFLLSDIR